MSENITTPTPQPLSIRAAAEALIKAHVAATNASPEDQNLALDREGEAWATLDQALAQPEVSRADLIERAVWAEEGIAKMKAGEPVLPIHIQAIVTAAEAGLQAHRSFDVRWKADMRAIARWRAAKPSREISELLAAAGPVVGSIKRAAMLGPIPEDAKRLEAALEDALSYSIEAAVPERRAVMLPDHADLVVWLMEVLERPEPPLIATVRETRDDLNGQDRAQWIAQGVLDDLAAALIAADRRAFLAEQQAIPVELPDLITEVLASELADSYDCTRVWEAWSVGTMSEEDFEPLSDRVQSITVALMDRIAPFTLLGIDEADRASLERVAGRLGLEGAKGSGPIQEDEPIEPAATVRTIEAAADAGLIPGISSAEELRAKARAQGGEV